MQSSHYLHHHNFYCFHLLFCDDSDSLPCKECAKSFSESKFLKAHLNHFLWKSHSPVPCSLFHKRKSVVPFKDLKIPTSFQPSLLHHFRQCPLLSPNMWSMFWLLRRSYTTILQRIFQMRKEKLLSCQSHFQIVLSRQLLWQS